MVAGQGRYIPRTGTQPQGPKRRAQKAEDATTTCCPCTLWEICHVPYRPSCSNQGEREGRAAREAARRTQTENGELPVVDQLRWTQRAKSMLVAMACEKQCTLWGQHHVPYRRQEGLGARGEARWAGTRWHAAHGTPRQGRAPCRRGQAPYPRDPVPCPAPARARAGSHVPYLLWEGMGV